MREMKDSGIEWIGQIPKDWELSKIGAVYEERNQKVNDTDFPPLSVTKQGIVHQLETAAKTNDGDNRKLIRKNDFVINSRSDRRGSCGISEYDGSCSLINTVLKPRRNMCNKYYSFVFRSECFADEFYRWGTGIVDDLWSTKWSNMKRIYIPLPDIQEQNRIADYLDKKCSKIDEIISTQQKVIEKLKEYKLSIITEAVTKGLNPDVTMKDSGVEWIGEIPEHWQITKIKHKAILNPKCDFSNISYDTLITYTPMECIKNGYYNNRTEILSKIPSSLTPFEEGDIVMAKVTPCFENGNIAIMNNLQSKVGLGSSELFVFRSKGILTKYLFYFLQNINFTRQACLTMTGAGGLKRVSSEFCKNCKLPLPPYIEQEQIADYLDSKCEKIDFTISKKQKLIDKLKEYKKSLIYEVVTGKKEV